MEFRLGEVEALPVADKTADVIISNCVLNLSTRRQRAFEEAFRALKPGGRLVVSDLISGLNPPEILSQFPEIISGCMPIPQDEYVGGLEAAGFTQVEVIEERYYAQDRLPVNSEVLKRVEDAGGQIGEVAAYVNSARSAVIQAIKA